MAGVGKRAESKQAAIRAAYVEFLKALQEGGESQDMSRLRSISNCRQGLRSAHLQTEEANLTILFF